MLFSATQQYKSAIILHTSSSSFPPSQASQATPHPIPLGHQRVPHWTPCALQQLLTSYPSHAWWCKYAEATFSLHPTLSPQLCPQVHFLHLHLHSAWPIFTWISFIPFEFPNQHPLLSLAEMAFKVKASIILAKFSWVFLMYTCY